MYAFPWGVPGTALADEQSPEPWQRDILERLGEGLISTEEAVRAAVASGHGVGKSALVSWIVLWALSTTVRDTRGVVTANTEGQLRTKTWPELAKWYGLCLNRSWFTYSATALASTLPGHEKTWRVYAITWSETPQLALLYLSITRCALRHSLRDRVNVFAGLYCFTVQLDSFRRTSRLIST
jgi:hypothetical protein